MYRIVIEAVFVLLAANCFVAEADGTKNARGRLSVWLIPFDPPFDTDLAEEETPVKKQLDAFNRRWAASGITVLNTTVDWMVDQLVVWSQEYDMPNWALIRGQEKTLEALGRFANTNNLDLRVRFLKWKNIIPSLEKSLVTQHENIFQGEDSTPDVLQIGSTWAAYFAEKGIALSPGEAAGNLSWRKIDSDPVSLPYTMDVRLMFYWKRMPGHSKPFHDVLKKASDWQGIVGGLSTLVLNHENPAPPMVMPTALTFNLFHDFVPLVWASGEPFFVRDLFGTRTNMGKAASLKVPLLISRNATINDKEGHAHRVISFPEMSQERAARHFMQGVEYVAIIQPAAFLSRWRRHFMKTVSASSEVFWECAGVALLPAMFKGGTDLMVVNGTPKKTKAFQLVRFLASDETHSGIASENGYLPAQNSDFGLNILLETLGGSGSMGAKNAILLIHSAIEKGREYPSIVEFPTRVESIEILESIQMLWRRIGEGNAQQVRKYAGKTALMINSRIYWPSTLWVLLKRLWPAITLILALSFFGLYLQSRKIAWRNRLLRIAVDSLRRRDYVLVSRAGAFVTDCQKVSERECEDFSEYLHDLRTRTLRLEENIRKDLEHSGRRSFSVSVLIREAWENAVSQYRVAYPFHKGRARSPVLEKGLGDLAVSRMPYVLVALLQDWFYNAMKNDLFESDSMDVRLWQVGRKRKGLAVQSRYLGGGPMEQPFGPLPERVFDLMGEQSKAAYGRIPVIKEIETDQKSFSSQKFAAIFLPAPLIG